MPATCKCGAPTYAMSGRCNRCRKATRDERAKVDAAIEKRAKKAGVVVDRVGRLWWAWDASGNVLVVPIGGNARETKSAILQRWAKLGDAAHPSLFGGPLGMFQ